MLRGLSLLLIVAVVAAAVFGGVTLYDETLEVGRMWETPGIRPYEQPIPVVTAVNVPFSGGEAEYRNADPATLTAAFDLTDPVVIDGGRKGYQYFCIQCHGRHYDGMGTVGQSFSPLPGDLRTPKVQTMAPGQFFHEISYGLPNGRQPALSTTISVDDRWRIIAYIRSLGIRP